MCRLGSENTRPTGNRQEQAPNPVCPQANIAGKGLRVKAAAHGSRASGAGRRADLGCARAGRAGRGALRSRSAVGWYHGRRARGLYRRWDAGKSTMPLLCFSPLLCTCELSVATKPCKIVKRRRDTVTRRVTVSREPAGTHHSPVVQWGVVASDKRCT